MDEIDEWLNQLENDVTETVITECKDIIEDKMHENSNLIYEDYEPWGYKYQRRGLNGGYGDKNNIHTQIINNGNGDITLLTSNDTKGNSGETNTEGDNPNEYIDYIIEEGGGEENYKWRHSGGSGKAGHGYPDDFPLPRPVSEWTMDDLNETNIIENTIEKSLKSKGYNIK